MGGSCFAQRGVSSAPDIAPHSGHIRSRRAGSGTFEGEGKQKTRNIAVFPGRSIQAGFPERVFLSFGAALSLTRIVPCAHPRLLHFFLLYVHCRRVLVFFFFKRKRKYTRQKYDSSFFVFTSCNNGVNNNGDAELGARH